MTWTSQGSVFKSKRRSEMSNWIVITFDNPDEAGKVRDALGKAAGGGYLRLDDSAIVIRDEEGKIHIKNEVDRGVKIGAVGGSILGLLFLGLFAPIAGLVVGAAGGALVGSVADLGVDKKFVEDVSDDLKPGTSALFVIVREANPAVAIAALKPYKGTVYHTTLTTEAEESLRQVLSRRT